MKNVNTAFRLFCLIGGLMLTTFFASVAPRSLATEPSSIWLIEDGSPVNETVNCSYSEQHLIWLSTSAIIGYPSGMPLQVTDANDNVIAYKQMFVNSSNETIGYQMTPVD